MPTKDGVASMKKLALLLTITAAAGAAHAADLPTTKPPPPAPPVNCYSSLWAWLNSTAADCPLSYGPFTAYVTLDWGFGWESHGAGYNAAFNNGVSNIVTKQSGLRSQWLQTPNGINQSVVGVKVSQPIAYGWSLVGTAEVGFNPYWGYLADAQAAQFRITARRSPCRTRTPIRAALASGTTRKGFSASATRPMARSPPAA